MGIEDGGWDVNNGRYGFKSVGGDAAPRERVYREPQLARDRQKIHAWVVEAKLEAFRRTAAAAKKNALVKRLVGVAIIRTRHPIDMRGVERKLENSGQAVEVVVDAVHEYAGHEAVVRGAIEGGTSKFRIKSSGT